MTLPKAENASAPRSFFRSMMVGGHVRVLPAHPLSRSVDTGAPPRRSSSLPVAAALCRLKEGLDMGRPFSLVAVSLIFLTQDSSGISHVPQVAGCAGPSSLE